MLFMNEGEIDQTLELCQRKAPELVPFARFLSDWRHEVNAKSDGWHSWPGGCKAAAGLITGLEKARKILAYGPRHGDALPAPAELKRALGPIRACATRHRLTAPTMTKAPAAVSRVRDFSIWD
jgi:hypothetical protein